MKTIMLGTLLGAAFAAALAAGPTPQLGVEGAINRCRDRSGKVVYVQQPCANEGMEQLGVVRANPPSTASRGSASTSGNESRGPQHVEETGGDGIIWIDPSTGGVQYIPIEPSSSSR